MRPIANDTGLEIDVMTSDDLVDWFTPDELGIDYLPISETTESLDDDYRMVTQVYPIQNDGEGRFYRIKVESFEGF